MKIVRESVELDKFEDEFNCSSFGFCCKDSGGACCQSGNCCQGC